MLVVVEEERLDRASRRAESLATDIFRHRDTGVYRARDGMWAPKQRAPRETGADKTRQRAEVKTAIRSICRGREPDRLFQLRNYGETRADPRLLLLLHPVRFYPEN